MQDGGYFSRVLHIKYGTIFTDCNQVLVCSSLLISITTGLRCQYKGQNIDKTNTILTTKDSLLTMNSTFHSRRLTS
jgi:hypothetical protein